MPLRNPDSLSLAGVFARNPDPAPRLADALAGRGAREVAFADGRRSLAFVTAAYHAGRTGLAKTLPLDSAHSLYKGWSPEV